MDKDVKINILPPDLILCLRFSDNLQMWLQQLFVLLSVFPSALFILCFLQYVLVTCDIRRISTRIVVIDSCEDVKEGNFPKCSLLKIKHSPIDSWWLKKISSLHKRVGVLHL